MRIICSNMSFNCSLQIRSASDGLRKSENRSAASRCAADGDVARDGGGGQLNVSNTEYVIQTRSS